MGKIKKQYSEDFKFKVAMEAMKGAKTMAQLCSEYSVHETQIKQWKQVLKDSGASLFGKASDKRDNEKISNLNKQISQLNEHIGELSVENRFLKKSLEG